MLWHFGALLEMNIAFFPFFSPSEEIKEVKHLNIYNQDMISIFFIS